MASIPGTLPHSSSVSPDHIFPGGPPPLAARYPSIYGSITVSEEFRASPRNSQRLEKLRPKRRKISPQAGRAIEMLGHAIEYLEDEYALDCMTKPERALGKAKGLQHPQIIAIELLKTRNREVFFSCPELPALRDRLRSWLRLQRA